MGFYPRSIQGNGSMVFFVVFFFSVGLQNRYLGRRFVHTALREGGAVQKHGAGTATPRAERRGANAREALIETGEREAQGE